MGDPVFEESGGYLGRTDNDDEPQTFVGQVN